MKKFNFLFCFLVLLIVNSCGLSRQTSGYYSFPPECLGVEFDGSETLLVFADGRNRKDAIEQAKKEAVRAVVFKGLSTGKLQCELRPLLSEVNAERKYEVYFAKFFKDNGDYLNYVSVNDERLFNKIIRDRMKGRKQVKNSVVCRVEMLKLKEKFINDEILKQ